MCVCVCVCVCVSDTHLRAPVVHAFEFVSLGYNFGGVMGIQTCEDVGLRHIVENASAYGYALFVMIGLCRSGCFFH